MNDNPAACNAVWLASEIIPASATTVTSVRPELGHFSVPLRTVVAVAGQRWRIEESFQAAKGLVGLDQHQVRRWPSWHRWTTLAMLAHAFLAVATAIERDTTPTPAGLIALTVNEFRRLFDALLLATNHTVATLLAWSRWR